MATPVHDLPDRSRFWIYEKYLRRYGIGRSNPSKDPYWDKPKERRWWPMRYFMGDWILAVWVYRIESRERCEVGLFLAEDHTRYVKDSGIKGGLISLLTQTFHLLGKMEVFFIGPSLGREATLDTGFEPEIPSSIRRFASDLGISFGNRNMITDEEGRLLYARMTGFSKATIAEFGQRGIDLTRACFVVQRDIWSFEHVEYLLRNAYASERVFSGGALPIQRLSFQHDLLVLRLAVMEERLRTLLEKFSGPQETSVKAEWKCPVRVCYVSDDDLSIPTLGTKPFAVRAGTMFEATLSPRSTQGYATFQKEDLTRRSKGQPQLLAVTKDFEWAGISSKARSCAHVVHLFDTLVDIDLDIEQRLSQAVSTRAGLSERHD